MNRLLIATALLMTWVVSAHPVSASSDAAGDRMPLDDNGNVVNFERDIVPIFKKHCVDCHLGDDAKVGFDISDPDLVGEYIEPGDSKASSLMVDYMLSEEEDLLMPPRSFGGPMSPSELALVGLWIDEGADWPDGISMVDVTDAAPAIAVPEPTGLIGRLYLAQGYLHPATVHFPIAFYLLGGLFVVIGIRFPVLGTQIPLACLWLGTLASIAAGLMGWSFSVTQGYGGWNRFSASALESEVFWHRWTAIIVTLIGIFSSVSAIRWVRRSKANGVVPSPIRWKAGLLLCAALIGAVGHQGGEMTYGADFYPKMFRTLTGDSGEAGEPGESEPDESPEVG